MLVELSPRAKGESREPATSPHPTARVIVIGVVAGPRLLRKYCTADSNPDTKADGALPTLLSQLTTNVIPLSAAVYCGGGVPPPDPPPPGPPPTPPFEKRSIAAPPDGEKPPPKSSKTAIVGTVASAPDDRSPPSDVGGCGRKLMVIGFEPPV